jgi:hypothetical protein
MVDNFLFGLPASTDLCGVARGTDASDVVGLGLGCLRAELIAQVVDERGGGQKNKTAVLRY